MSPWRSCHNKGAIISTVAALWIESRAVFLSLLLSGFRAGHHFHCVCVCVCPYSIISRHATKPPGSLVTCTCFCVEHHTRKVNMSHTRDCNGKVGIVDPRVYVWNPKCNNTTSLKFNHDFLELPCVQLNSDHILEYFSKRCSDFCSWFYLITKLTISSYIVVNVK